ncbi:hypothetical protein CPB84DRAFT_1754985 [Gymnopilus junonius]|uniref:Uncharacterized protein n=1 Tax=Gymnopilus junonius TaxID=109634 RepID=A0A9P5N7Y8_GYMJU|nr:hypothetical protein CPB84DRAFT_1754985 [Gymnopilus junonius]
MYLMNRGGTDILLASIADVATSLTPKNSAHYALELFMNLCGGIPAIAITNLVLSLLPGKPTYYQTTSGILGKMYSTNMMVLFNNRMRVVAGNSLNRAYTSSEASTNLQRQCGQVLGRVILTQEEYTYPLDDWNSRSKKAEETCALGDA